MTKPVKRSSWFSRAAALVLAGTALLSVGAVHAQSAPPVISLDATADQGIVVTNLGSSTIKAVIVNFNGTSNTPVSIQATGFIHPETQSFVQRSWRGAPARDRVKVFSFNVKTLEDAGIDNRPPDLVADAMVEELFFNVVRNAQEFADFEVAYAQGLDYHGILQSKAWGSTISAEAVSPQGNLAVVMDGATRMRAHLEPAFPQ